MSACSFPRRGASQDNKRGPLPTLFEPAATVRELTADDAPSLYEHICHPVVVSHIAAPPQSEDAFREFIRWTHGQRAVLRHLCFGIVPPERRLAVGLIQIWPVEPGFAMAEWGFVLGADYWGTGLFPASAKLVLDFVFGTMGVQRLEARCAAHNDRGNGVLRKLGATAEGVLRGGASAPDHLMWSLLAEEWRSQPNKAISASVDGGVR